jgi:RNA polymerase sigma-70 factor, ECF subfamily
MDAGAPAAAETVAHRSYGRLLALVAQRTRDIAAAEDALAEAFARAMAVWPRTGVPDRPEAWLLTVARRAAGHGARHAAVRDAAREALAMLREEVDDRAPEAIPDARLKLLFTCAHPAIDPGVRTALMLQVVLGLDAVRIGAAFVVPAATIGQRLVRAKAKIRHAGIPFETPEAAQLPERLQDVLEAIYAAYGAGWDGLDEAEERAGPLVEEALFLGRLVVAMLPEEPEPKGLLALMLHCEARRPARRGPDGEYVPLLGQDQGKWLGPRCGGPAAKRRGGGAVRAVPDRGGDPVGACRSTAAGRAGHGGAGGALRHAG